MKFTTLSDACEKLRSMGQQFICPKDQFFGPLADVIMESFVEPTPRFLETFKSSFDATDLDAAGMMARTEDELIELRKKAGDFVRSKFLRNGYFNGVIDSEVTYNEEKQHVTCCVVVSDFGYVRVQSGKDTETDDQLPDA